MVLDCTTSSIPKHILQPLGENDPWPLLIVATVYEYLKQQQSRWYHYFRVLPTTSDLDTLMFWSSEELAQLKGSAVLDKIGKQAAEESWKETIIPLMLKDEAAFPITGDGTAREAELIRLCHLAGSLIMAYAFDIDRELPPAEASSDEDDLQDDDEENPMKAMVPLADMLNAKADQNNARLFQEDDFMIMKTIRSIGKGEEIFNDYGLLPRSDLLRMYGYVTDNYAQYDVVELAFETLHPLAFKVLNESLEKWNERLIELRQQEFFEDAFALPRPAQGESLDDTLPFNLKAVLKVLCADKEPFKHMEGTLSTREATVFSAALQERLKCYSTSIDEDNKLLEDFHQGTASSAQHAHHRRYHMAIEVRKGEKEVCAQLIQLCQARTHGNPGVTHGTTKRAHETTDAANNSYAKRQKKAR